MPKNVHFVSCMIGVWKAGAAFVLVEEGYPKERIEYIRKDVNCVQTLDNGLFHEIMESYSPLGGSEKTQLHDAAYAVYTSGSTGNPKGVLHEYGNIDQCVSTVEEQGFYPEQQNGFVAPLTFVAAIMYVIINIVRANTNHLISSELLRNFRQLTEYIREREIERI